MELGLAGGQQNNLEDPFLSLDEGWTLDLGLAAVAGGVLHLELPAALDLNPVVEGGAGSHGVGSKAGIGVIDLEQAEGGAGLILHGDVDVGGVAGGQAYEHG